MIVYYSGTGNSRYVADMLAALLDDTAYDAFADIRGQLSPTLLSEKPWVFVAPVYVSAPPLLWMDYLRRCRFEGSRAAYFAMTCAGGMGACPAYCGELCGEIGLDCRGTAQIVMPQNYVAFFKTKDKPANDTIITAAGDSIRAFAATIAAGGSLPPSTMKKWELDSTKLVLAPYYKWFIRAKAFRVTDACIGCGKCERVCPLGNVKLVDKHPVWGDTCTHCMACISYCPVTAIEYGKKTVGKPRHTCKKYQP